MTIMRMIIFKILKWIMTIMRIIIFKILKGIMTIYLMIIYKISIKSIFLTILINKKNF